MNNVMCSFYHLGVVREQVTVVFVSLGIRSIISLLRERFARGHTVLFVLCTIKSDENCASFPEQY